jgi:hypothetical protein
MKCLGLSLSVLLLACGTGKGSVAPALPDVPFDELSHDQRLQLMKERVLPAMTTLFQQHNPEKYQDFGCKTCHGEAADRGEFHMPNDKLPKLNFTDMSKFKPADVEWMKNDIKPTMASILREPEFSDENPDGFGCLHCHPSAPK